MRFELDIQYFGGRGSSSGGGGGGTSGSNVTVLDSTSLISEREGKQTEVDATLRVLKAVEDRYGVNLNDVEVVTLAKKNFRTMAYYDAGGNLAVNTNYFNSERMNGAYDSCVASGFHPPRGNKTGLEAVVAHEMGHKLNHVAGGNDWDRLDATADAIVREACRNAGYRNQTRLFRSKISGYASRNNAEAVAEAFADVYCNGNNASKESRAIVTALNKYF